MFGKHALSGSGRRKRTGVREATVLMLGKRIEIPGESTCASGRGKYTQQGDGSDVDAWRHLRRSSLR